MGACETNVSSYAYYMRGDIVALTSQGIPVNSRPRQVPRNVPKSKLASLGLAERISRLSRKRQEIIRPVQEHPRDYVLSSVRDLAARLQTDPATVVRIVRGLGFTGYREFKHYLHEMSIAQATTLEGMQASVREDSGLFGQMRRSLLQDVKNLYALRNLLDLQRVTRLVKRIYEARRILILGGDMTISLVEFLEYNFAVLGLPVYSAKTPGAVVHATRTCGQKHLVLAISFRGLRQTVEGLRQARDNGAYCVAITNSPLSPLSRFADDCFVTPAEAPFANSYAAPMAFINVLLVGCAYYRRARTLALLKKVDEEQRHGFRWYREGS